jgi:hypothetical protein
VNRVERPDWLNRELTRGTIEDLSLEPDLGPLRRGSRKP